MLNADLLLRGDEHVTSHADPKGYEDGGSRWIRIESGKGAVTVIFTGSDEDIATSCDVLTGHLQRVKSSLLVGAR